MIIKQITYQETKDLIMNVHYAGRMPPISYAFGLFDGDELIGVVTYGMPVSQHLCNHICGEQYKKNVLELNRLVLKYNRMNEASYLVANSMKLLPKPTVVVSYADTAQGHQGIVYQACNFLFTGTTRPRTDIKSMDGKHSRHYVKGETQRVNRSAKHRYVTFVGDKIQKHNMRKVLKYKVQDYPK